MLNLLKRHKYLVFFAVCVAYINVVGKRVTFWPNRYMKPHNLMRRVGQNQLTLERVSSSRCHSLRETWRQCSVCIKYRRFFSVSIYTDFSLFKTIYTVPKWCDRLMMMTMMMITIIILIYSIFFANARYRFIKQSAHVKKNRNRTKTE